MRKIYSRGCSLSIVLLCLAFALNAQSLPDEKLPVNQPGQQIPDPQLEPQFHEDRFFVKIGDGSQRARSTDPLELLKNKNGIRKVSPVFPITGSKELSRIYQVEVDTDKAEEIAGDLKSSGLFDYAEKVPIYYTFDVPNDPLAQQQYALSTIKAFEAFSALDNSTQEITVAVVDDGVYLNHEDLRDRIYYNPGEQGTDAQGNDKRDNGIDDDNNGYIDDWRGWDAADEDNNPNPPLEPTPIEGNQAALSNFFHGTFCAGIVGAATNNGTGMATIARNSVKILPVKATENETANVRSLQATFEGVLYAISAGAEVVNMSYGGGGYSQAYQDLINFGASQGIVFVAAAGNDGSDEIQYPAGYDNVIAVANTGRGDVLTGSSSYGSWVDIAAPGTSVLSTTTQQNDNGVVVDNGYQLSTGTSFSSPLIASLVGLLKQQAPSLTTSELEAVLKNTADDVSIVNPGFEGLLGGGRINAYAAAVAIGGQPVKPTALFSIPPLQDNVIAGSSVQFYNQSTSTAEVNYQWEFPGGEPEVSSAKHPVVTYSESGVYDVTLTVSDAGGSHSYTLEAAVEVDELLPADLLDFPFNASVSATIISGHSGNNIPAFANKFFFQKGRVISGARFSFLQAVPGTAGSNLRVVVWAADQFGKPGKVIYRQPYLLNEIEASQSISQPAYHDFVFENPVEVPESGVFFIGMEIDYGKGDQVTVHHYPSDGQRTSLFFLNQWRTYNSAGGGAFDFTMLMFPAVADPALTPDASFSISRDELCLNQETTFSVNKPTENIDYQWFKDNNSVVNGEGSTFPTMYIKTGEFNPKLYATRVLKVEKDGISFPVAVRQTKTSLLRVADCKEDVDVNFASDKIALAVGGTVQFENKTENATRYTWTFEGGTPKRSDATNPVVTYDKPGTYSVELKAKNPRNGNEFARYSNYITVFEPGEDCFEQGKPFAQPFSQFNFNAGGPVSGHNNLNIATYARRFELEPGSALTSVLLSFRELELETGANSSIKLQLWSVNDESGTPLEVVYEESVPVSTLIANTDIAGGQPEYNVKLRQPFTVPANGQVYAGIGLTYDNKNVVALNLGAIGSSSGLNSGLSFNGSWLTYGGIGLPADLAIAVGGVQDATNAPVADFQVLTDKPAVGFPIRLNGLLSENGLVYSWSVSGGELSSTIEPQTTVTFSEPGTYEITLVVSGNCENKLSRVSKTITVGEPATLTLGDCDLSTGDFEGASEIIAIQEVTYADFARRRGSFVIGVATGIRADGQAGAWEIHSDCSVKPLRRSGLANRTTLLPDVEGIERSRGWKYVPTSISEDGREIFAAAFNERGFTHKRGWTVEAGTRIDVKFTLGTPFYGRIRGATGSILCDNLIVETFASNYFVISCDDSKAKAITSRQSPGKEQNDDGEIINSLEENVAFKAHAFPNPVSDKLQLMIKMPFEEKMSIIAYDMLGRLVMKREVVLQQGNNKLMLQVDEWNTGARQLTLQLQSPSFGNHTIKLLKP